MKIKSLNFKRGMTFIELVVVIGIFGTISGVVLFNFTGFSTSISLQNLSNQIALQLKKAQTESLSGLGATDFALFTCATGPCRPSYGIHFDMNNKSHFYYFADRNNDEVITGGTSFCPGNDECLDDIRIQTGDLINAIATTDNSGGSACQTTLDITFRRPFPDTIFNTPSVLPPTLISKAGLEIVSPKGAKKTIIVWSTGQVEIKSGALSNYFNATCS